MSSNACPNDEIQDEAFVGQNPPPPMHHTQPPGQPLPHGTGQLRWAFPCATSASSELRMCELRENLERQRLLHAEAMLALEIARHQSNSYYDSLLRAGSRVHAEKQRQPRDDAAAAETAAAASTPQELPMFAPLLGTPQTTAARAEQLEFQCIPSPGMSRSGISFVNAPSPGRALSSLASEDHGSGNRKPTSEGPLRNTTTQPVIFPHTQAIQHANSHHQHAKAPCAALPSDRCGNLHSGIGCPGSLESHKSTLPAHAVHAPFNKPPEVWQDTFAEKIISRNMSMNSVGNVLCASGSLASPL